MSCAISLVSVVLSNLTRVLFQNFSGLIPEELTHAIFGSEKDKVQPMLATRDFRSDCDPRWKILLAVDESLQLCDPPYTRFFRTDSMCNGCHVLESCEVPHGWG